MSEHAVLSPSKAARWIHCPGSAALCDGIPDTSSAFADEGTAAHAVAAARLQGVPGPAAADKEASDYIAVYCTAVRNAAFGKTLLVEQRLDLERWTTEQGGKGTADAIIIDPAARAIEVWDLKFGKGVMVDAQENEQLMLYALGALDIVELLYGEVQTIKLVICQPRRDHLSDWTISREDLLKFGEKAKLQGKLALYLAASKPENMTPYLHPSEKACRWCVARAACPAIEKAVIAEVFDSFEVLEDGSLAPATKPVEGDVVPPQVLTMIEGWVAAKRAWIDARLFAGTPTPGWKLVLGKRGNRKWRDEALAEQLLKRLKFKKSETHVESLIPLTKIEKMVPAEKWPLFAAIITQADGQPTAVPESDKRPEYTPTTAAAFENQEDLSVFL